MLRNAIRSVHTLVAVALITLLALVLRVIGLADVPPRWDEGWSIAHASLNLADLFTITAADVHPPLFYMLLGLWQSIVGANLFADRYLAVLMSLPAVPLAFATAMAWGAERGHRSVRMAIIAAMLMAWLPLAVYYSAVIRMYALAPTLVLLATWAALRLARPAADDHIHPSEKRAVWVLVLAFVIGAAGAMLTLYHAVWAFVALGVYVGTTSLSGEGGLMARLNRLRPFGLAVLLSLLVYAPWALFAIPQLQQRASTNTGNIAQQYPITYFAKIGIEGLTMSQTIGIAGLGVLGVIVIGALVGWRVRPRDDRTNFAESPPQGLSTCVLPVLTILLTLIGVAAAAQHWAFNARMLICATPGLVLLLAWSLEQWSRHSRALAGAASLVLIGVYWSTSTGFVYQKTLEVFDPYDPHTYYQHIAAQAQPKDEVFFNVLSPAGFYALDRKRTDPAWSYALTWDPVIEPRERWEARITQVAQEHARLWVVLYRGLTGSNGDLRGWLDSHFFPANAEWGEEGVFYGLYGAPREPLVAGQGMQMHWYATDGFDLELHTVALAAHLRAGDILPVSLVWRATAPVKQNYKVFVHAFDVHNELVAQHDAQPLNDLRPMTSLPVGSDVIDHHGLSLPATFTGTLRVVVGLYNPATGERVRTAQGDDEIAIGRVDVRDVQP